VTSDLEGPPTGPVVRRVTARGRSVIAPPRQLPIESLDAVQAELGHPHFSECQFEIVDDCATCDRIADADPLSSWPCECEKKQEREPTEVQRALLEAADWCEDEEAKLSGCSAHSYYQIGMSRAFAKAAVELRRRAMEKP